jgi:hypothetical protein
MALMSLSSTDVPVRPRSNVAREALFELTLIRSRIIPTFPVPCRDCTGTPGLDGTMVTISTVGTIRVRPDTIGKIPEIVVLGVLKVKSMPEMIRAVRLLPATAFALTS